MRLALDSFNLLAAERLLHTTGSIVEAAALLGLTRHALKRRIIKHQIRWPRSLPAAEPESPS